jgi:hypothetical protein
MESFFVKNNAFGPQYRGVIKGEHLLLRLNEYTYCPTPAKPAAELIGLGPHKKTSNKLQLFRHKKPVNLSTVGNGFLSSGDRTTSLWLVALNGDSLQIKPLIRPLTETVFFVAGTRLEPMSVSRRI